VPEGNSQLVLFLFSFLFEKTNESRGLKSRISLEPVKKALGRAIHPLMGGLVLQILLGWNASASEKKKKEEKIK